MGLDTVEFVITIEKELHIKFDERVAAKIYTAGELQDYILTLLPPSQKKPWQVWHRLKRILMRDYRVPASSIKREARIVKDLGLD